jgi:predicted transcriptional regulator
MEVHFTPDLETKLARIAAQQGRNADELIQDALVRYLEDEVRFIEAVQKGIASADRGDFIEHDEVVDRIEKQLGMHSAHVTTRPSVG